MSEAAVRRVLLVGFMGSGKTTVGRLVAGRLGWTFLDQDSEVEAVEGRTIAELFESRGEAYFRGCEARVAEQLLRRPAAVIAAGGGWRPAGGFASLPPDTLTVWLRVSAVEAVRRAAGDATVRPLLAVPDPVAAAEELLAERTPFYSQATLEVDTEASHPEDVSARIVGFLGARNPDAVARENVIG